MITASDATARLTSFWVMAPTPRSMIRRSTSAPTSMLSSAASSASTEPEPSPLRMRLSVSTLLFSSQSSSEIRLRALARAALRSIAERFSAICRAMRSSSATRNLSPASGTEVKPSTCTGRDGPASVRVSPGSSRLARPGPARALLGQVVAVLVEHRPDAAVRVTGDDRAADVQRAALDEDRRHRTTAAVEVGLDRDAAGVPVAERPQVESRRGREQDRLEQPVDVEALAGGDLDEDGLAAVLL